MAGMVPVISPTWRYSRLRFQSAPPSLATGGLHSCPRTYWVVACMGVDFDEDSAHVWIFRAVGRAIG
jgi:hypothetical protein